MVRKAQSTDWAFFFTLYLAKPGRPKHSSKMKWENIDEQVCSVARALSIVGERWTLLIIRDAFKGTRRFEGFHKNLGVTRHRLTERLNSLVESGVMTKVPYSRNPERFEYRLTRKGLGLYPDNLAKEYFGEAGMLGYVAGVQRKEIRQGIACVKHQNMAGSDMGDDHKEYFSGDAALKAGGTDNTMNQFG